MYIWGYMYMWYIYYTCMHSLYKHAYMVQSNWKSAWQVFAGVGELQLLRVGWQRERHEHRETSTQENSSIPTSSVQDTGRPQLKKTAPYLPALYSTQGDLNSRRQLHTYSVMIWPATYHCPDHTHSYPKKCCPNHTGAVLKNKNCVLIIHVAILKTKKWCPDHTVAVLKTKTVSWSYM